MCHRIAVSSLTKTAAGLARPSIASIGLQIAHARSRMHSNRNSLEMESPRRPNAPFSASSVHASRPSIALSSRRRRKSKMNALRKRNHGQKLIPEHLALIPLRFRAAARFARRLFISLRDFGGVICLCALSHAPGSRRRCSWRKCECRRFTYGTFD